MIGLRVRYHYRTHIIKQFSEEDYILMRLKDKTSFSITPAITSVCALVIGIVLGRACDFNSVTVPTTLVGLCLACVLWASATGHDAFKTMFIVMLCVSTGFLTASATSPARFDFDDEEYPILVFATVNKIWSTLPNARILILNEGEKVKTGHRLPGKGRLFLRDNDMEFGYGDVIGFKAKLRKPTNRGNPGEYDWEADCNNNGIRWLVSISGENSIFLVRSGCKYSPGALLFDLRKSIIYFLDQYGCSKSKYVVSELNHPDRAGTVRGIMKGIVVGDMGEVSYEAQKSFSDSGLAHALSASGLHVAIVALLVFWACKLLSCSFPKILLYIPAKELAAIITIPAILFYCFLVGARDPAVRSTIMGVIICAAVLMRRPWNSANSLAVAAFFILLFFPSALFTPSFQLSFAAVAGIFAAAPYFNRLRAIKADQFVEEPRLSFVNRLTRSVLMIAGVSIGATLAISPLILIIFHSFPTYSVPANIMCDFLFTPALGLGLLAGLTGTIFPEIGSFIAVPAEILIFAIIRIAEYFSQLPFSTIVVPHPTQLQLVTTIFMVVGIILIVFQGERRKGVVASLAVVFCLFLSAVLFEYLLKDHKNVEAYFLNVGKGDSTFIRFPGSRGILIDGGVRTQYFDAGKSIILPFLGWAGSSSLDAVIMSHPEADHIGGLPAVLNRLKCERILWNAVNSDSLLLQEVFNAANRGAGLISSVHKDAPEIRFGESRLKFLNGKASSEVGLAHKDLNNSSVVARLEHKRFSILLTGDLELEGEKELLLADPVLKSTVLKVAHHGGKNTCSQEFLAAVAPKVVIISADYPASHNLPHPDTVKRLESTGAMVLWTGRDGAVSLETDGNKLFVSTGKSSQYSKQLKRMEISGF